MKYLKLTLMLAYMLQKELNRKESKHPLRAPMLLGNKVQRSYS